jgi:predicted MPP superfamily phosphohydrolase
VIPFVLVFFTVYGAMNAYVFMKARAALGLGPRAGAAAALLMAFMVAAPVLVRMMEMRGFEPEARLLAYAGYTWFGLVFLFISASLLLDAYRLALHAAGAATGRDMSACLLPPAVGFYLPLLLSFLIFAYGYFEAREIRTGRLTVKTGKLPPGVDRLRVVQISDVHLGLIVREERLSLILEKVRAEAPDILVSTGDLVDGQIDDLTRVAGLLRGIEARYGKYAVTGNHEYYAGLEEALAITGLAGFRVLRDEAVTVAGMINIAGVDYPSRQGTRRGAGADEKALLSGLPADRFTLLLKHAPHVGRGSPGRFDLQLSGHTHMGQIFPFSLMTRIRYPRIAGYYGLENGSGLYVSRGSGTWGPPIRFLAPPEVTVVDLVREGPPPPE